LPPSSKLNSPIMFINAEIRLSKSLAIAMAPIAAAVSWTTVAPTYAASHSVRMPIISQAFHDDLTSQMHSNIMAHPQIAEAQTNLLGFDEAMAPSTSFYPVAVTSAALLATAAVSALIATIPSLRGLAQPVGGIALFLGCTIGARASEMVRKRG
jgi:hypothetical protein